MTPQSAVLDTNIFVAAGFNDSSACARLMDKVRGGALLLVWHRATRAETKSVLKSIPNLSWQYDEGLFTDAGEYEGPLDEDRFEAVADASDRKFAALAAATDTILVSHDDDLLGAGRALPIRVLRAHEMLALLD